MLTAVELDHQPPLEAGEIDDVRTDWDLAAESHSEGPAAKLSPEPALGVRHVLAQVPGVAGPLVVDHWEESVAGFLGKGNVVVPGGPLSWPPPRANPPPPRGEEPPPITSS